MVEALKNKQTKQYYLARIKPDGKPYVCVEEQRNTNRASSAGSTSAPTLTTDYIGDNKDMLNGHGLLCQEERYDWMFFFFSKIAHI